MINKTFIIIVTYNGMQWLPKCLECAILYPTIIIDNNSNDGTVSFIEEKYPDIILLKQKQNLGFGQANNLGISFALKHGADYVFLLNQDAYLESGCIEKLIQAQKRNPEYGILSPLHLNGSGNRLDRNFSNYLSYQCNSDFYSDYVLNKTKKEIYKVPFVNAAAWLVPRACLEKVGGFDPIFFHYGEDDNYCQRVIYHGLKVGVFPESKVMHDREDRIVRKVKPDTAENFKNTAKYYKVRFANINIPYKSELLQMSRRSKKAIIKNIIKLNFSNVKYFIKEAEMYRSIHNKIIGSRSNNVNIGSLYLKSERLQ